MGRRRSIAILLVVFGLLMLFCWFSVKERFEGYYQGRVKDIYHSIGDARDILRLCVLPALTEPRTGLPEGAVKAFLRCPSVIEVVESKSIGLVGLSNPKYYPRYYPIEIQATATTPDILKVANIEIIEGRFLNWEDIKNKNMVCVLEAHPSNPYWFGRELKIGDYLYGSDELLLPARLKIR